MSALAKEKEYTIEDIYSLPEGIRGELIDGDLYMMAPPSPLHQQISIALSTEIRNYIKAKNGPCEVNYAPFAVFLDQDDQNYVEPDIFVVCDKTKISDRGCEGAPDWVIEILSPASERYDLGVKLFKYRSAGVREYWVVSPSKKTINVFLFSQDPEGMIYTFEDHVPVSLYPDFAICISDLMS